MKNQVTLRIEPLDVYCEEDNIEADVNIFFSSTSVPWKSVHLKPN